jgi:hypothetical protein
MKPSRADELNSVFSFLGTAEAATLFLVCCSFPDALVSKPRLAVLAADSFTLGALATGAASLGMVAVAVDATKFATGNLFLALCSSNAELTLNVPGIL